MQRVCPKCESWSTGLFTCPKCNVPLLSHLPSGRPGPKSDRPRPAAAPKSPTASFVRKIVAGLLLAQGLYYGARQLLTSALLASGVGADWWATMPGVAALQTLQGVAVLAGSLLAGAGQSRGLITGALLGLINSGLLLIMQSFSRQALPDIVLYGQPLLQAALGAVGGLTGGLVWRPTPAVPSLPSLAAPQFDPAAPGVMAMGTAAYVTDPSIHKPKVYIETGFAVSRILVGALIAALGTLAAPILYDVLPIRRADSGLHQFVIWEISAFAMLAGGSLAGAYTSNGFKQGVAVGTLAGIALASAFVAGTSIAAMDFVLTLFGGARVLGTSPGPSFAAVLASSVFLCAAGGCFGGQLLPKGYDPKEEQREAIRRAAGARTFQV